jgi:hypothetical protein
MEVIKRNKLQVLQATTKAHREVQVLQIIIIKGKIATQRKIQH